MRECLGDLWEKRNRCGLKHGAYAVGWFGAIYRIVGTLSLAIIIAKLDDDDIFILFYSILLAYCFVSLAADFLLIFGISKRRHNYLLPYLGIYGIEILAGIVVLVGGIGIFIKLELIYVLSYFIPCGVIVLGTYIFLWSVLVRLYHTLKLSSSEETTSVKSQTSHSGYIRCRCICFSPGDSLDIIT